MNYLLIANGFAWSFLIGHWFGFTYGKRSLYKKLRSGHGTFVAGKDSSHIKIISEGSGGGGSGGSLGGRPDGKIK